MFSWRCHSDDRPAVCLESNHLQMLLQERQIEDNRDDAMRKPLLALAVSAFGIGTSEFIIMGLLPDLAHSFRVSIPKTGILVSGYALSVTLGSPLVALALSRMDRKRALLILMGMFLAGNALCALAPTFLLLLLRAILLRFATEHFSVSAASWLRTWCHAPSGRRQLLLCSAG